MTEESGAVTKPGNSLVSYPDVSPIITVEIREKALEIEKEQRDKKLDIVALWKEQGITINE